MRNIFLYLFIYLLSINLAYAENVVTSVEEGVVRIINHISENKRASGTGFVINANNYVVTNHHVIKNHHILKVLDGGVELEHLKEARVIWASAEKDLAILHVPNLTPRKPLKLNASELEKASVVLALGFPGAADKLGNELDFVETSATDGRVSRLMRNTSWDHTSELFDIIQHSAQINGGNSGGPLINQCGEVVGVNTASAIDAQGIFYASHISSLIEILNARNIDFQSTTSTCSTDSIFDIQYLIMLTLIILTFLIIVLAFRQPRQQVVKAAAACSQLLHQPATVFYGKTAVKAESTTLWVLKGQQTYLPINQEKLQSSQGITIGRAAKLCDLSIRDDTISRRHARLSYDKHQLLLEDLNSVNGTRINGQQIQPYHPMSIDEQSHIQLGSINFKLVKSG
ncbi:MAG: trypsin-like peptidase domain-containing protein [Thiotrichaceae bacterium]|nr:trypsin-like peptidase domain-containing protein [Thiotrichaceae bacterium]